MKTLENRFWEKVRVAGPDDCWEWLGAKCQDGYGNIRVCGKTIGAHRLSYEMNIGKIGKGMCVLHSCDNPGCVNPAHFREGTHQENMIDKCLRGRQPKGENHPFYGVHICGEDHHAFGKKQSQDHIRKRVDAKRRNRELKITITIEAPYE